MRNNRYFSYDLYNITRILYSVSNTTALYDLYNTETEQVEATEHHSNDEILRANDILCRNGEPQRWVATPWVNH